MLLGAAQVIIDRENIWVAHCGNVCIAYPRGETVSGMITDIGRCFNILAKRVPTGIGLLLLIGAGSPAPAGAVRDAAVQMFSDFEPKLKLLGMWVEGSGFVAATKRSVLTLLVSRIVRKKPVKVFAEIAKVTDWMEEHAKIVQLDQCPTSEELQLLIDRSRSKK